jgi:hypothetical protein
MTKLFWGNHMRINFFNIITKLMLALILTISFSSLASAESDFYKTGIRMGTTTCSDSALECENLSSQQKEIMAIANACTKSDFMINESVMSDFRLSGEFENCVLSDRGVKDSRGVNNYAVCCVKKAANSENCTMYLGWVFSLV